MPDLVWFLIRRLFAALLVMLALSLAVYLIFYAIPADPAHLACGKPVRRTASSRRGTSCSSTRAPCSST